MANEQTALLSPVTVERCYAMSTPMASVYSVPLLALRWHPWSLALALMSCFICWLTDNAASRSIDPLIFKSVLVVFGLTLGFRLVRANCRLSEAEAATKQLFQSTLSIFVLLPDWSEPTCREQLLYLLDVFCEHINIIANRYTFWYGLIGLRPKEAKKRSSLNRALTMAKEDPEQTEVEADLCPRALMVSTICMCGEVIHQAEDRTNPGDQNIKRLWWETRQKFIGAYDEIEKLTLPSVSDGYVTLINFLLGGFGVAIPWGVNASSMDFHTQSPLIPLVHIPSGVFLALETIVCALSLYGLSGLAQEIEDPFDGHGLHVIELSTILRNFKKTAMALEQCRDMFRNSRAEQASTSEEQGEQGADAPPPSYCPWADVVQMYKEAGCKGL